MSDDYWDPFADPSEAADVPVVHSKGASPAPLSDESHDETDQIADPWEVHPWNGESGGAGPTLSSPAKKTEQQSSPEEASHVPPAAARAQRSYWTCEACGEENAEQRSRCNNCGKAFTPAQSKTEEKSSRRLNSWVGEPQESFQRQTSSSSGGSQKPSGFDLGSHKPSAGHTQTDGVGESPKSFERQTSSSSGGSQKASANLTRKDGMGEAPKTFERQNSSSSSGDSQIPLNFTLEKALEFQDQLIEGYMSIEFQEDLWTRSGKAYGNKVELARARLEATFPVQAPILERFGFAPTRQGLHDSVRAFAVRQYNDVPEVQGRNLHLEFLVNPGMQDVLWKGEVRRKRNVHTGQVDNTTLPPLISNKQADELEGAMIEAYSKEEFQAELRKALLEAGGDEVKQARARQRMCLPIQIPVVQKFGFAPTRDGVRMSVDAFKPLAAYPKRAANAVRMMDLVMKNGVPADKRMMDLAMKNGVPVDKVESKSAEPKRGKGKARERRKISKPSVTEKSIFVPGVGLSVCQDGQSRRLIQKQDITTLNNWPLLKLAEDALIITRFIVDAPYPELLQRLSRMGIHDEDVTAKPQPSEAKGADDGLLVVLSQDDCTWMQQLQSSTIAVEGGVAHRITIIHSMSSTLTKEYSNRQEQTEHEWQRRMYSYREINDFFSITSVAEKHAQMQTLVTRSICGFEAPRLSLLEGEIRDLKLELARKMEQDNERWLSCLAPTSPEAASKNDSEDQKLTLAVSEVPELTEEVALELQDLLISRYTSREYQEKLHIAHAKAGGDAYQQAKARNEVTLPFQCPVVQRFGFPPTKQGVFQSVRAFRHFDNNPEWYPKVKARNDTMQILINVPAQDPKFVESVLSDFARSPAPRCSALRSPELYKADKELVSLAAAGSAAQLRLRLQFQNSDPNIIVSALGDVRSGFGLSLDIFCFGIETTPLIAAVDNGQQAAFEVFLKFRPMVDINVVCYEWAIERAYKRYTALDRAIMSKHKCAPFMLERLISLGAASADDLPLNMRKNPFYTWEEHFPDAKFSRAEIDDIAYYKKMASTEGGDKSVFRAFLSPSETGQGDSKKDVKEARSFEAKARPWNFPDRAQNGTDKALEGAIAAIKERIFQARAATIKEQQRLLRQFFLQWHPDKQRENQSLATKVFQWLQELREKTL